MNPLTYAQRFRCRLHTEVVHRSQVIPDDDLGKTIPSPSSPSDAFFLVGDVSYLRYDGKFAEKAILLNTVIIRSSTSAPPRLPSDIHTNHYRILFGIDVSSFSTENNVKHLTHEEQLFRHFQNRPVSIDNKLVTSERTMEEFAIHST